MALNCGIVGLPNVGKSTLFNALTQSQSAETANYAFCTIEPNSGTLAVPDPRLTRLAELVGAQKVIPAQLEIVDIAGLVKGASKGAGLGNQFLANIRETDAILHLVRCFDGDVEHVEGRVDPVSDAETISTELLLADLESLERRIPALEKRRRGSDKEAALLLPLLREIADGLAHGQAARQTAQHWDKAAQALLKSQQLLSAKPVLYIANVGEDELTSGNAYSQALEALAEAEGSVALRISAAIEAEIAQISDAAERQAFLDALGMTESGLERLIRAAYGLLDLITFFTAGPKEARAWTLRNGARAPEAAGVIHSDFERGFIRAETIAYADFDTLGGEAAAKEAGKLRKEGKDYLVQDGDVLHVRFNL